MPIRSRVLLIVDNDEAVSRESTTSLLEASGCVCATAPDAEYAWKLLESEIFDVVVSLVRMERHAEVEFVKQLAASSNRPAIILLTGSPCIDSAVATLDPRLVEYLEEPCDVSDLSSRIELALKLRNMRGCVEQMQKRLSETQADLAGISELLCGSLLAGRVHQPDDRVQTRLADELTDELVRAGLISREREVVNHLVDGYRISTIARRLFISPHTVRRHLKSVFLKLEVRSQAELLEKLKPWPLVTDSHAV